MRAQAIDDHRPKREPDALMKLRRLLEGGEVHIRGKLFGG
jgi:hypothetical protein